MRLIRKITAVLVTMAVAFSFAACSAAKTDISVNALTEAAKKCGCEQTDNYRDMGTMLSRNAVPAAIYYVAKDKDEATSLFKSTLGRMASFPRYDVNSFAFAGKTETGSDGKDYSSLMMLAVFADSKTAAEVLERLNESYVNDSDAQKGTKGGYSYVIEAGEISTGARKRCAGLYIQGNTILYIEAGGAAKDNFTFVDSVCKDMGIISPSTAKS